MMTTADIIRKVRELEIKSRKLSNDLFKGEYHSAFKGRGMSFKEVREYQPGDDIRFIDWNVSARFSHPFSKVFEEERELTVLLLVDVSSSALFGTHAQRKKDVITEVAAVLTFSAINNNDKVGVIFFSDKVEKYVPPRKGRQHALYIVREMLTASPQRKGTRITEAVRYLNNSCKQKSIAFLLSDFLDESYEDALRVASSKHDLIGIKAYDRMDMILPDVGLLEVEDAETGSVAYVDTSSPFVRKEYEEQFHRYNDECKQIFLRAGSDLLHIGTGEDYVKVLQKFFAHRNRR
ncbi:uncharacterized protein DUF58 [Dinghuibacter silviterrae]|uniref:Uncharacterized protein DUF58 n=2 Tax=Dinghuibacter silviterrae TaxID=1539049 RepID=A0A4V3GLG6_9BACT|nr:uncharacterized protein DUF58 [Dinghuibacter silviterrae]